MSEQHSPLAQFEIKPLIELPALFGHTIHFTNSSLFMVLAVVGAVLFLSLPMRRASLVPTRWQSMAELSYIFIANLVKDNAGNEGMKYFPFIFSLFMFILFCNLLGMVPGAFTVTSHIIVTFGIAGLIFIGVTAIALAKQGMHFFAHFLPSGTPLWMAPLIYPVEVISYMARPVSLSIRLAANMMAGHTMMKVVAGFVVSLLAAGGIWMAASAVPFAFVVALTGFEIGVALLQAYIFTILTCVYLNEALHSH